MVCAEPNLLRSGSASPRPHRAPAADTPPSSGATMSGKVWAAPERAQGSVLGASVAGGGRRQTDAAAEGRASEWSSEPQQLPCGSLGWDG